MKYEFHLSVEIKDGAIQTPPGARKAMLAAIQAWPDCKATLTLKRRTQRHSDAQRGYYFGVLIPLGAEATGYTESEFHELMKAMHLDKREAAEGTNGHLHGELVIGGSIADLPQGKMAEFLTRVREWMLTAIDCPTPDPDPNYRDAA